MEKTEQGISQSKYIGAEEIIGLKDLKITGHKEEYTVDGESVLTIFAEPKVPRPHCPVCDSLNNHVL